MVFRSVLSPHSPSVCSRYSDQSCLFAGFLSFSLSFLALSFSRCVRCFSAVLPRFASRPFAIFNWHCPLWRESRLSGTRSPTDNGYCVLNAPSHVDCSQVPIDKWHFSFWAVLTLTVLSLCIEELTVRVSARLYEALCTAKLILRNFNSVNVI